MSALQADRVKFEDGYPVKLAQRTSADRWVLIGNFAIRTASVLVAARIAAKLYKRVKRTRQQGTCEGVRWMCLALWSERC